MNNLKFAALAAIILCSIQTGGGALAQVPPGDALPGDSLRRLGSDRLSHQGTVFCTAFSPDGKILASGGGYGDATIRLWNPTTGQELLRIKDGGVVRDLAWSADGKRLFTASDGDGVRIWDIAARKVIQTFPKVSSATRLALSSDGKTLAIGGTDFSGSRNDFLILRDVATGKELHRFDVVRAYNVVFSPDGQTVAVGGASNKVRLWEVSTGKELPSIEGHKSSTYAVAFSPNGKLLVSGATHGDLWTYVWEWPSRRLVHRFAAHEYGAHVIRFSPDGNTVAIGSGNPNGIIHLWDVASGKELAQLKGHRSPLDDFSFSPDGKQIASSGSWERTIRLWNVADAKECNSFARHHGEVAAVAFAPDGQILATASHDQTVGLWKTSTGEKAGDLLGHTGKVNAVAYSPDGKLLATGSDDKSIRVWSAATGKQHQQFQGPLFAINSLAFSPDGRTLASGEGMAGEVVISGRRMPDRAVRIWSVATGKTIHEFQAKTGRIESVAFSPDGRILASAGPDWDLVHLWDPTTGKPLGKLETAPEKETPLSMSEGITHVAFSPDGRTLVSVSGYRHPGNMHAFDSKTRAVRMVRLWEVSSRKERFQIKVPFHGSDMTRDASRNEIYCAAFSADSQTLILGKVDGTLSVWDLAAAKETRAIAAHRDKISGIAILPDGKTIATGSGDTTALLWDGLRLLRPKKTNPVGLTLQEREALWTDLASSDGLRAYHAIWTMAREARDGLLLVKERVKPVPKVEAGRIAQMIKSLDSANFTVRDQAMAELTRHGEVALPSLRDALTAPVSLEVRRRIEKLLETFGGPVPPEVLRSLRGVEMLERLGNDESRQVLQTISEGAPEARLTQDAKASLKRLETAR